MFNNRENNLYNTIWTIQTRFNFAFRILRFGNMEGVNKLLAENLRLQSKLRTMFDFQRNQPQLFVSNPRFLSMSVSHSMIFLPSFVSSTPVIILNLLFIMKNHIKCIYIQFWCGLLRNFFTLQLDLDLHLSTIHTCTLLHNRFCCKHCIL